MSCAIGWHSPKVISKCYVLLKQQLNIGLWVEMALLTRFNDYVTGTAVEWHTGNLFVGKQALLLNCGCYKRDDLSTI